MAPPPEVALLIAGILVTATVFAWEWRRKAGLRRYAESRGFLVNRPATVTYIRQQLNDEHGSWHTTWQVKTALEGELHGLRFTAYLAQGGSDGPDRGRIEWFAEDADLPELFIGGYGRRHGGLDAVAFDDDAPLGRRNLFARDPERARALLERASALGLMPDPPNNYEVGGNLVVGHGDYGSFFSAKAFDSFINETGRVAQTLFAAGRNSGAAS